MDRVFDMDTEQHEIYDAAAMPIIESVFEGFNGTIFAYGQTSSGKTHTMQGTDINDEQQKGIIPRIVSYIFNQIDEADDSIEFTIKVSMIEIYMERIRDLLDPKKINLQVHEDKEKGIFIGDVTETYVTEAFEVYQIMQLGNENRSIGVTDMNKQSSRSHSCFIITITQNNSIDFSCKTGKLYLVDLAGSEKISKTNASGQTLNEAKKINKSLSTLGLVINNLTDGKSKHIPYRDSKLTRILQESLGGNSKTCLIITCSPSVYNEAETISTLRFGQRAKKIQNKPKINKELSVAELKLMLDEAERKMNRKDRYIRMLQETIKNLGGTVPTESDTPTGKLESEKKEAKNDSKKGKLDQSEDTANVKIDALGSSDDEFSDEDGEGFDDGYDSGTNTEISDTIKSTTSVASSKHRISKISTVDDALKMFQKVAGEHPKKDQSTMTEAKKCIDAITSTINK